jgi:hypothetical protein
MRTVEVMNIMSMEETIPITMIKTPMEVTKGTIGDI